MAARTSDIVTSGTITQMRCVDGYEDRLILSSHAIIIINLREMSDRFEHLDPTLQKRIRRSIVISGLWLGVILLQAGIFIAAKPHLDKRREEKLKIKTTATASSTVAGGTHFAEDK